MNKTLKNILLYGGIVLFFLVLAYGFVPEVLSGKIVNQSDISSWKGMSREIVEWNEAHPDDRTYWTNSMFSGMPATTISVIYHGDITKYLYDVLFVGQRPASYLIICMVGAFRRCRPRSCFMVGTLYLPLIHFSPSLSLLANFLYISLAVTFITVFWKLSSLKRRLKASLF